MLNIWVLCFKHFNFPKEHSVHPQIFSSYWFSNNKLFKPQKPRFLALFKFTENHLSWIFFKCCSHVIFFIWDLYWHVCFDFIQVATHDVLKQGCLLLAVMMVKGLQHWLPWLHWRYVHIQWTFVILLQFYFSQATTVPSLKGKMFNPSKPAKLNKFSSRYKFTTQWLCNLVNISMDGPAFQNLIKLATLKFVFSLNIGCLW